MNSTTTLDDVVRIVRNQFRDGPPNGWLLGWDESRYFQLIAGIASSHSTTNCTSFDYGWCNWYQVRIDTDTEDAFWTLTIKLSQIVAVYCIHWTYYDSPTSGAVIPNAPTGYESLESKVRSALERVGFMELPDAWYDKVVDGVELELSGTENVTLGKCLFSDYDG